MNLRQLAEETANDILVQQGTHEQAAELVHSALLEAIRQFAQREQSEEMLKIGDRLVDAGADAEGIYKAMLAQALKELEQTSPN